MTRFEHMLLIFWWLYKYFTTINNKNHILPFFKGRRKFLGIAFLSGWTIKLLNTFASFGIQFLKILDTLVMNIKTYCNVFIQQAYLIFIKTSNKWSSNVHVKSDIVLHMDSPTLKSI